MPFTIFRPGAGPGGGRRPVRRQPGRPGAGAASRLAGTLALLVGLTSLAGCSLDREDAGPTDGGPGPAVSAQPSGGALPAPDVPVGTSERTLTVDGRERTYRLYRPASAELTAPVPLVVMLHGAAGTGAQAEESYGWTEQADKGGFVVAFPDGLNRAWAVGPECCGAPARDGVDDVSFITELVATIGGDLPVDPARTYVTGISNGGLLAYRLVCDTTVFAAVGAVATTLTGQCPAPKPVSVLHIHGQQDKTMPYGGGPGRRDNGGTGRNPVKIDGPPTPELAARWRSVDGCAEPKATTDGPVTRTAATCAQGRAVELITIAGAGHQWPGGKPNPPRAEKLLDLDPPSTALNATDTIWRFFAAHPKPAGG
ncbi:Esterase PHB depolymerase [Micromonospora sp. MW-13]|uniref:extracellular catalytic domain type 1 short-chain-length polyhydroxyalkanoate depolymerase n=1 Tax=Micromonospora sp. MW-13 TaxID=2094022 RepID=UPI000EC2DD10|nr:PHB depolymerase family esterase [Micromonospora sp. MW-13]RGC65836.1 Esterase PHB depolymerase [Micromonospora sp. MW-13]